MSESYKLAAAALADAAETVSGVRVLRRPGAQGAPPLVYVPPPSLTWDGYEINPTDAVFEVVLAVAADEYAIERLYEFLPPVCEALDTAKGCDATVKSAEPGVWRAGSTDLPAYFIRVEAATS
jgi:hypothetical protein